MRRLLFVMLAATMAAAATKTTSKLTTAGNVPMSPERYQYEQATKFNKAVDDIDTLMARVSGAANDSLGARELIVSDSGYIDTMTTAMGKATKLYVTGDSLKVTGLVACDTLAGTTITTTAALRVTTNATVVGKIVADTIDNSATGDVVVIPKSGNVINLTDRTYVGGDSLKVTGLIACDTLAGKVTVTDTLRAATKLIVGGGSVIDSIAVIDGTNDTLVIKIGGKAWKIDMDTDL